MSPVNAADAVSLVERKIEEGRELPLIKALGALVVGVVGIVTFTLRRVHGGMSAEDVIVAVAILGAFVFSAYLFSEHQRRAPDRDPLVRVLREAPTRVVWIYEVPVVRARTGAHVLTEFHFGCIDGASYAVTVARVETEVLRTGLDDLCPRAVRDYSDRLAAIFREDPARLVAA